MNPYVKLALVLSLSFLGYQIGSYLVLSNTVKLLKKRLDELKKDVFKKGPFVIK